MATATIVSRTAGLATIVILVALPALILASTWLHQSEASTASPDELVDAIYVRRPQQKQRSYVGTHGFLGSGSPRNVTIALRSNGYELHSTPGGSLRLLIGTRGLSGDSSKSDIRESELPLVERDVNCRDYPGRRPPPAAANLDREPCAESGFRRFEVYDQPGLRRELLAIKEDFPSQRMVVIAAETGLSVSAITAVMDLARETDGSTGERRPLFDEQVLSPWLN